MAAQHTEGHAAAVARGLVAVDATRSSTAPPLRPDSLDAATQSAIVEAVAEYDMVTAQEDQDASGGGGGGGGASATKSSDDTGDDSTPQRDPSSAANLSKVASASSLDSATPAVSEDDALCVQLAVFLQKGGKNPALPRSLLALIDLLAQLTAQDRAAAVARGLAAADATRSSSAPMLRPDALDAATQSAIIEAVTTHDAMVTAQEDHDASGGGGGGASAAKRSGDAGDDSVPQLASNLLGETVAAILLVRSELTWLRYDTCVSLQLELVRRGAEEQWVGRASEWKAEALELVKARADEQTQLGAEGMKYGVNVCARRSAIGRAMLRFLGTGDLLRCAEACRTLARWSKGAVLALKFREDVSDAAVAQIAAQYVNLRVVDLSRCVQVTDVSIVAMAESCPWLKSVDLSGKDEWGNHSKITDVAIVALAEKCDCEVVGFVPKLSKL